MCSFAEVDGTCNTYGGDEEFVQNFCEETSGEETLWDPSVQDEISYSNAKVFKKIYRQHYSYRLSQHSSWINPYLLFRYVMLFTLDELCKSEGLHNVPIIIEEPTRCNNNLLIYKVSSTCFGQSFAHLQERKTENFTTYGILQRWIYKTLCSFLCDMLY